MKGVAASTACAILLTAAPAPCQNNQTGPMKIDIYRSAAKSGDYVELLVPAGTDIAKAPFAAKIKSNFPSAIPTETSVDATPRLLGATYRRTISEIESHGYAITRYIISFETQPR
jgi:hypothetical protein